MPTTTPPLTATPAVPTTPPVAATAAAASGTSGTTATKANGLDLGKDAFLKLMVEQLRHQNPLDPTDGKEFVSQLAQMTSLEQLTNVAGSSSKQAKAQAQSEAVALVGKTVTYRNADGSIASGVVERVDFAEGGPSLTVGGRSAIPTSALVNVSATPIPTSGS